MNPAAILAIDPLLSGDIGLAEVLIVLLKTLVAFGLLLTSVIFMIWFERKLIGDFQNRVGPNKAGPWGLLQTLADGLKLIMKEDLIPDKADRKVFRLAPFLSAVPAFVTFAVVPIGGGFDGKLMQRLGLEFCHAHTVLPLRTEGSRVVVGALSPSDVFVIDEIRSRLRAPGIKVVLVTPGDVRAALEIVGGDEGGGDATTTLIGGSPSGSAGARERWRRAPPDHRIHLA